MANVRIAQILKQAHGLRAERSGRAAAVGDDPGASIRQKFGRPERDVGNRKVDRARNVPRGERLGRQHVDEREAVRAQAADELVA